MSSAASVRSSSVRPPAIWLGEPRSGASATLGVAELVALGGVEDARRLGADGRPAIAGSSRARVARRRRAQAGRALVEDRRALARPSIPASKAVSIGATRRVKAATWSAARRSPRSVV